MEAFFHFRVWELDGSKEPPFRMVSNGGICVLVRPGIQGSLTGAGHVVPPTEPYQKKKARWIVQRKMECWRKSTMSRRCTLYTTGPRIREATRTLARTTAEAVLRAYTGPGKTWLRRHVLFSRPVPRVKKLTKKETTPPGVRFLMREGKTEAAARKELGL